MTLFTSSGPQESNSFRRAAGVVLTSQRPDPGIALELACVADLVGFFELRVATGRTGFFVLGAGALDADRPKRPMSAMMWHLKNFT